jgi:hypothetical protein
VGNLNGKEVGEMHLTGTGSGIMRRDDQMKLSLNVRQAASGPDLPLGFSLGRMYPNPFNPITHFSYALPADARVKISVFDVLGRQVASLVEGRARAGLYQAEWDGNSADGLPAGSGVYYIRMSASARTDFSEVRKVLLIR